jgi:hypothetical protein
VAVAVEQPLFLQCFASQYHFLFGRFNGIDHAFSSASFLFRYFEGSFPHFVEEAFFLQLLKKTQVDELLGLPFFDLDMALGGAY